MAQEDPVIQNIVKEAEENRVVEAQTTLLSWQPECLTWNTTRDIYY